MQEISINQKLHERRVSSEEKNMNTMSVESNVQAKETSKTKGVARDWPRWTPYAAVVWSVVYGIVGLFWAMGGNGFPFTPGSVDVLGPLAGRLGLAVSWIIVSLAGFPAAILGLLMLRGVRRPRLLFIIAGGLIGGGLLLLMLDLTLLTTLGYIPYTIVAFIKGTAFGPAFLNELGRAGGSIAHQLWCLAGGFAWLAATVTYTRKSGEACLYCGRRDDHEGWNSPEKARQWGKIAAYLSMVVPVIYGVTRYAWALGIPLGMTQEYWRQGQERGMWTSGLFLATFGLVGAVLTLGLVQRWGEVFPRWMVGLAGRRVPMWLAVVPATLVSVLLIVGGVSIGSGFGYLSDASAATEQSVWIVVGPAMLFPLWGVALAVATLGYYFRRRGPCSVCGRGGTG
jgi:hypothetical protein